MTTIALARPIPPHRPSSTITPPLSLESSASSSSPCSIPIPNKHLPACPTGPARPDEPDTPPPSPPSRDQFQQTSVLYPPDDFARKDSGELCIYELDAPKVAEALDVASRQPLPDPALVFPWFHGLHPQNHVQQTFFSARRHTLRPTPSCLRSVTLVKADGDLNCARLKGAVAPNEILQAKNPSEFIEADPREGFSVRNFQIQTVKTAVLSDIIVYGSDLIKTRKVAWHVAGAQKRWRERHENQGDLVPEYHTFICTSPFSKFEEDHSEIVAVDGSGRLTGNVLDFFNQERREMWAMTEASEFSQNVFMGPTPEQGSCEEQKYDILIECSDLGRLNPLALQLIAESPDDDGKQRFLDFPSSGSILPPTWSHSEADGVLETCKWIYHLAHGLYPEPEPGMSTDGVDGEGDSPMPSHHYATFDVRPRKILLHCADGYTESTMLSIAYFSYSTGHPVPQAWLQLHTDKKRNFFAYPTDVALLTSITPRLLRESPVCKGLSLTDITHLTRDEPSWFAALDGSFPSRVLDYMYLGNLGHANNPDLLKALGITQILSVGEVAMWREGDLEDWGKENVCVVQGVQDNGIDPLTEEFARCLEFIDRGRRNGTATLVHCRVGVSRSATICIAEVMRTKHMSFPHAYCYVRARRLNVIIQPHLRFAYELLKYEEVLQQDGNPDGEIKRTLEWAEIAREIALMNRPYSR
ncbi:Ff.00g104220.m01.CDS01 [Fusarium sp. VM40]|nr:Ff.00g104220.m01.CDS01 [Fusarium sp. VM40]